MSRGRFKAPHLRTLPRPSPARPLHIPPAHQVLPRYVRQRPKSRDGTRAPLTQARRLARRYAARGWAAEDLCESLEDRWTTGGTRGRAADSAVLMLPLAKWHSTLAEQTWPHPPSPPRSQHGPATGRSTAGSSSNAQTRAAASSCEQRSLLRAHARAGEHLPPLWMPSRLPATPSTPQLNAAPSLPARRCRQVAAAPWATRRARRRRGPRGHQLRAPPAS